MASADKSSIAKRIFKGSKGDPDAPSSTDTQVCPFCKKTIPADAKVCPECHMKLKAKGEAPPSGS